MINIGQHPGGVPGFLTPFQGVDHFLVGPAVYASLRPPATFLQPSRLTTFVANGVRCWYDSGSDKKAYLINGRVCNRT